MNYTTRLATKADYPYCYRLTKKNMFDLFSRHWGGWEPSAFRNDFSVESTTMVMYEGRRMGFFTLKENQDGLHLDNIQLSSTIQGKGIGTALLKQILSDHSSKQIALTTFSDNPAMRLYERLGFTITEREGETIRMTTRPTEQVPRIELQ